MAYTIDSFINSIRRHLVPIHPEGYVFIVIFGLITTLLFFLSSVLGWIGVALTFWCTYFFRDPPRVTPLREGIVVSPADGVVCDITYLVPPSELNLGSEERQRISIFMNVFDCHINRAPIEGRIDKIVYRPGLFLNADLNKASEHNERNALIIEHALGRFGVVQIAGVIARRIATFKQEGQNLERGERFGIIRFGSRVDVYLPSSFYVCVGLGSRTIGGETVIADSLPINLAATFKTG